MNDSRYPYTYACDMIRRLGPVARDGVVLSRSDVSHIRQGTRPRYFVYTAGTIHLLPQRRANGLGFFSAHPLHKTAVVHR
jgi:hypothetical protein